MSVRLTVLLNERLLDYDSQLRSLREECTQKKEIVVGTKLRDPKHIGPNLLERAASLQAARGLR